MERSITVGGRRIGEGQRAYVIAEMSANHNQDFDKAVAIMEAAKDAGADAIKIQTYTPDTMTIPADSEPFTIGKGTIWEGRNLYDLYSEAQTPWDWQPKLKSVADELRLDFFSTAFDASAVDLLESIGVAVHKVSSFEIVDIPLIEKIAGTGKPLLISTGMSTLEEIREAVEAARGAGASEVLLLKCTSAYPASPHEMNLRTIPHLIEVFDVPVGLSDHTPGADVPVAAVALGACLVEKHLTLSREVPGPDSAFSLEPQEFRAMVASVRAAEDALGTVAFGPTEEERNSLVFRRSLFVVEDVRAGEPFTEENVRSIRPGYGMPPKFLEQVLGRRAAADVSRGTPLSWALVAD